jgi:hypothetical protein
MASRTSEFGSGMLVALPGLMANPGVVSHAMNSTEIVVAGMSLLKFIQP